MSGLPNGTGGGIGDVVDDTNSNLAELQMQMVIQLTWVQMLLLMQKLVNGISLWLGQSCKCWLLN